MIKLDLKSRLAVFVLTFSSLLLAALMNSTSLASAASTACTGANSANGTDTQSISVNSGGTYYVWSRILAPSTSSTSFYVQVDSGTPICVGNNSSIPASTWTWVNYANGQTATPISVSLTCSTYPCNHTLTMTGDTPGVGIDEVLFLSDPTCVPTGTGTNCTTTTTSPTVNITSPATGATVSGTTAVSANASESGGTIANVQFKLDGTNIGSPVTTSPYTYNWNTTTATNGTHTLTAVATDTNNNSTTSSGVSVNVNNVTDAAPTPPSNVTATSVTINSVGLSWGASTDTDSTPLAGYHIWRAIGGTWTQIGTVSASTLTYTDTTVSQGTAYSYAVRAYDTAGNISNSSNVINVTTKSDTPPVVSISTPTSGSTVSGTVNVSATASDDTSVTSVQFKLDGSLLGNALTTAPYSLNWDTKTASNGSHTLTALATDSAGLTTTSASVTVTVSNSVPDTTPPTQPTGLSASAPSSSQVNLSWNSSTDPDSAVAGYNVYRSTSGGTASLVATVSTPSFGDTGLSQNTTYSYYVVAFDPAGNKSTASATVSVTTPPIANTTTVEGVVTSSTTGSPLSGAYVHTGIHGTLTGAATAYTDSQGQYILQNITPNRDHSYSYSDTNYRSQGFSAKFPAGITIKNVALVPR